MSTENAGNDQDSLLTPRVRAGLPILPFLLQDIRRQLRGMRYRREHKLATLAVVSRGTLDQDPTAGLYARLRNPGTVSFL